MAITATFYTFSKKKNSTKRPTGGTDFSVELKDPTSILNPQLLLKTSNPRAYNYCYIASFDRYYFISDWVSDHGLWVAQCAVDVLASWRTSINSSSQYVVRSASAFNTYIPDGLYPGTDRKEYVRHTFATTEKCFNSSNYVYVIGVMNGIANAPRLGGVTYYVLTTGQLQTLMNCLLGDADYLGQNGTFPTLFGITKEVMQALVNPTQYMVDSFLLPYEIPYTQNSNFTIGWWTLPGFGDTVKAISLQNMVYRNEIYSQKYQLSNHPQSNRGLYMNGAPFTKIQLFAGPFGDIELDPTMLVSDGPLPEIRMTVVGDYLGNVELTITSEDNDQILVHRTANVKVPFQIGQMFQDRLGMVANKISGDLGAAGAGLSGNVGGLFMGGANSLMNSFSDSMPKLSTTGSTGALLDINKSWIIQQEFTYCVDDDYAQRGRPLCEVRTLSSLEGYVTILDPEIAFACYDSEHDAIVQFMQSGFFLE